MWLANFTDNGLRFSTRCSNTGIFGLKGVKQIVYSADTSFSEAFSWFFVLELASDPVLLLEPKSFLFFFASPLNNEIVRSRSEFFVFFLDALLKVF